MVSDTYRFSPIKTKEELFEAVEYIAFKTAELCRKVKGTTYPLGSLTVFSHYPEEFEKLKEILFSLGELDHENNGPFVKLHTPIQLDNNKLDLLRVRHPDSERPQVGCNDFEVPSYEDFKKKFLGKSSNLRLVKRPKYEMIEFFDPGFDVLAYVLSKSLI